VVLGTRIAGALVGKTWINLLVRVDSSFRRLPSPLLLLETIQMTIQANMFVEALVIRGWAQAEICL
jgi:hypothetical protein